MSNGYIRVAAITPETVVADTKANASSIIKWSRKAADEGAQIIVFPELSITGYTCGELFFQDTLISGALDALRTIADQTKNIDALIFVGIPLFYNGYLRNAACALNRGEVLGFVPKMNLPNYSEFYEARYFGEGPEEAETISLPGIGDEIPIGSKLIFSCKDIPGLDVAAEICEDLWVPDSPSTEAAMSNATVIVNLSASDELTGKAAYRRQLVAMQSAKDYVSYIYSNAGIGESTQDVVYGGGGIIAENGRIIAETKPFTGQETMAEIDISESVKRRSQMTTFNTEYDVYTKVTFDLDPKEITLSRRVDPHPFVPSDREHLRERCEEILNIQAYGLRKRLDHTHSKCAVIGISGGLDSTLALLVTCRAFDVLGLDRKGIIGVTMPGFGTTDRTYDNAVTLIRTLGVTFRDINISKAVRIHFEDIGQDESRHDVTYENSQARERTQILMDIANKEGGLVIGTGDLSELALGWATYNGDHMSMYAVNCSVPKTLVRHLVRFYADFYGKDDTELRRVLLDVLDTPVSPELLPPEKNGTIAQKTEDLVGPYELHDFVLYYVLRYGFTPKKIFELEKNAFKSGSEEEVYDCDTIKKWLKTFYRRFFSQQFKRSAIPDGPKVGTVALSPRGDLRMPSDASARIWLDEAESL
ncbi:MAG: NAD(+) synthase [Lachnospiraceae bacterium]|uniref:Glutamine-dependent NAD(+) synthetase n=1 Tax=Candidatus Weimeria bifida TaxID=2599074 RepID=A0A6N7IZH9_9FIRM|nr:NAD(+) synthase [Candidatus Weimeria bifida]RRF96577.1 MAG: NAD(+) synthase [Lachnospiraceae bacterium]